MSQQHAPIHVFLVEDSPLIRARVANLLRQEGIAVVGQAQTLQSAIEGILQARPDVVVLDHVLDDGSGLEVLRAVQDAAPEIRFVVFTINAEPGYRQRYLSEGAASFLDKATESNLLVQAVKAASGGAA